MEQEDCDADTCSAGSSSINTASLSLENKVLIADFTSQGSSKQAGEGTERRGSGPPSGLMRDSLVQPFRPEELGISKSSLSVWQGVEGCKTQERVAGISGVQPSNPPWKMAINLLKLRGAVAIAALIELQNGYSVIHTTLIEYKLSQPKHMCNQTQPYKQTMKFVCNYSVRATSLSNSLLINHSQPYIK